MDLAVRFPDQGRIHLESRFLFSEPCEPECRRFLERVFQAPEITQITIKSQQGSQEVPRAELGYCPRTHTLKEVVDRVTGLLNPRKSRPRRNEEVGRSFQLERARCKRKRSHWAERICQWVEWAYWLE